MLKLCFLADNTGIAQKALSRLTAMYGNVSCSKADVVIALGGDGFLLKTMHKHIKKGIPFYGMNRGSVGFLLNKYRETDLPDRLEQAATVTLRPLRMTAEGRKGHLEALALNEVSLLRQSPQTADITIRVDDAVKIAHLICDGVLLSTPAGSTAYNYSAHGPILPLASNVLALTPVSPFRPRRWQGAILPHRAQVVFEINQGDKRPVNAVADFLELKNVTRVSIREATDIGVSLLFDPEYNLEDRVLDEQFVS